MADGTQTRPAFPALYAMIYPQMVEVARGHGYALALHGSLGRDMDVIAVPWTEDAAAAEALVEAIGQRVGGSWTDRGPNPDPARKPHGRLVWSLVLSGGAYIDFGVMPRIAAAEPAEAA